MTNDEARFVFFTYVSLQAQFTEAQTPEEQKILAAQKTSTLKMLFENGYRLIVHFPEPAPEVELGLQLYKNLDEPPIAEDKITIRLSEEQLNRLKEEMRLNKENALRHFNRFVNIARRCAEEGIASLTETSALVEAQEQALAELKELGWTIGVQHVISYNAETAEEGTPVILTFRLQSALYPQNEPLATEEVAFKLTEEEIYRIFGGETHDESSEDEETEDNT